MAIKKFNSVGGFSTGENSNVVIDANSNITANSVSATGNLTVSGVSDLGNVGNVIITGGSDGYVLTTDGLGNIDWAQTAPTYGNAEVANYLPTYTGNLNSVGEITANGNITANSGYFFIGDGAYVGNVNGNNITGNTLSSTVLNSSLTAVGDLASLSVIGNVIAGNISTSGSMGNISGANVISAVTLSASGNVVANTANLYSATVSQSITWPGGSQVYEDSGLILAGADGVLITSPNLTQITSGSNTWNFHSNATMTTPGDVSINGNVNANIVTANYLIGDGSNISNITGANIGGNISIVGNIIAGNISTSGSMGNIYGANVISAVTFSASGNITGDNLVSNYVYGNGSQLTGLGGFVGSTGPIGATGATGLTGTTGYTGSTGVPGGSASYYSYTAKTTINSGDPLAGFVIWSANNQITSTQINISHLTSTNVDVDQILALLKINDTIIIQDQSNSNNYQSWSVTTTPTIIPNDYVQIPVTIKANGGTGGTGFANNLPLIVILVGTGLTGATGPTGLTGATGPVGPVAGTDTQVIFNDGGVAAGNGNLTFNKTTNVLTANIISSANVNITGGNISNASITIKDNVFTLQDDVDPTKQARFQLSGLVANTLYTYTLPIGSANASTLMDLQSSQTITAAKTFSGIQTFSSATQNVGSSTANSTQQFAYGATISGSTKTINVGTGGVSGSTTNISIGSSVSGSTSNTNMYGTILIGGTAGTQSLQVGTVASSVNWVQIAGAITNASPTISAQGSDANINLTLTSKGIGNVTTANPFIITNANASTSVSTGALIVTGGMGITGSIVTGTGSVSVPIIAIGASNRGFYNPTGGDVGFVAGGYEQVRYLSTASTVNYLTLTGAIANSSPTISVAGSDANISLTLTPKGTGTIIGSLFSGAFLDTGFTLKNATDQTKQAQFSLSGLSANTTRTYTLPDTNGTLVTSNLTASYTGTLTFNNATQNFGSSTATGTQQFAYGATTTGLTKTVNFGTGGLSGSTTNIAIGSNVSGATSITSMYGITNFLDTGFTLQDDVDPTKQARFELSGLTTGTTFTYTLPAISTVLAGLSGTQTFSGSISFSSATLNFGLSTITSTQQFAYGATTTGLTKTVNFGTGGLSGSTTNIAIGSNVSGATSITTMNGITNFLDTGFTLQDDVDTTKKAQFQVSAVPTGTTVVYNLPYGTTNPVLLAALNVPLTFTSGQTFSAANSSFGTFAGTTTYNFASGATTTGLIKTVNVGTSGLSGSTTNIIMGATTGAGTSTTTMYGTNYIGGAAGTESLRVVPGTGTVVNWAQITGAATNAAPEISAQGSDANISLTLTPKGTGGISFTGPLLPNNLPGSAGQVLTSAGPGAVPTWSAGGSGVTGATGPAGPIGATGPTGSVGGSNTQVIFNDAGAAAGNGNLTFDKSTNTLTANIVNASSMTVTGQATLGGAYNAQSLQVNNVANAVNYVQVVGNIAASDPVISAQGSDTNVNLNFQSKGNGGYQFNGPGTVDFQIFSQTSSVNYLRVTPAIANANPTINSLGSDANIGLTLTPKGTGRLLVPSAATIGSATDAASQFAVALGTGFTVSGTWGNTAATFGGIGSGGSAAAAAVGIAFDTSSGGTLAAVAPGQGWYNMRYWAQQHTFATTGSIQFNIQNTSSAVNYLQATGSATNTAPIFSVLGSDTNISMALQSKGTGAIDLVAGSNGINISNGTAVTSVIISAAAVGGYATLPTMTFSAPTLAGGVTATVSPIMTAWGYPIASGGTLYTVGDTLTLVGGTFTNQVLQFKVATVSTGGVVTSVTVSQYGNYSALPANPVSVTSVTGSGATITIAWSIAGTASLVGGSGYIEQPTITISGSGGAAAYAIVGAQPIIKTVFSNLAFNTPGGTQLLVADGGSTSTDYIFMTGSWFGRPSIVAKPITGTNVSLALSGVGPGGVLQFMTNNTAQTQAQVSHTASAVNYVNLTGAAANAAPTISSQGSDANVGLVLNGKGTGVVALGGSTVANSGLQVKPTTSSVNFVQINGGASGSFPAISAQGTDGNNGLTFSSQGTGALLFTTQFVPQMYVTSTASAVNYVNITGAITTGAPEISPRGSDTNISLSLRSKGTGGIDLTTGTTGVNIGNGTSLTGSIQIGQTGGFPGTGYSGFPTVNISAPTGSGGIQAVAGAIGAMKVTVAAVVSGGSGYLNGEVLTVVGGTTVTAAATLTITGVSGNVITSVSSTNFGAYSVLPTNPVSVTGGSGTSATFTLGYGIYSGTVSITTAGSGYIEQPTITFTGAGTPTTAAVGYATVGSGTIVRSLGTTMSMYTPGGEQFRVIDSAYNTSGTGGAVNYIGVSGSPPGQGVGFSALGTDTNVTLYLQGKGTLNYYGVQMSSPAGAVNMQIFNQVSSVNYFRINPAVTGMPPIMAAYGSDTNIGIALKTQGSGAINLASGTAGINVSNYNTVTSIIKTNAGTGYTSPPSVAISAPTTAGGITATASVTGGPISQTIAGGGTLYAVNDVLIVSGGTSTIAYRMNVTTVSGGVITGVSVNTYGVYTVFPSNPVSVTNAVGSGSGATFNLTWGINSPTILIAGSGYIEQPSVTFSGGGGSSAAAYAIIGTQATIRGLGGVLSFNTPGGEQFRITDPSGFQSTTVNYVAISGTPAGNAPTVGVGGSDTNIALTLASKGTSPIQFVTAGASVLQAQVIHTASAVNYLTFTGATANTSPTIASQGSDTNVNLTLSAKNAGFVRSTSQLIINRNYASTESIGIGGATNYATGTSAGGVYNDITIDSTKTTGYTGYSTYVSTAAAVFNAASIWHFRAQFFTLGTGSTITNQYGFWTDNTISNATNAYGFYGSLTAATGRYNFYAAGTADNYFAGSVGIGAVPLAQYSFNISKSVTGNINSGSQLINASALSDVTGTAYGIQSRLATTAAAFTLTNLIQFYANPVALGSGSTVTNSYGFHAEGTITTATNNYGFFGNIAAATGRYNFYAAGTADNYFAGAIGIGTTSLAGFNLYSNRNLTGATTGASIQTAGPIQSDVTADARSFASYLQTSGTAFALTNARHYYAQQGSFGSTTVTNQIGFSVDSSLTGATNNYGFYGNIPSGANRYNFYAAGTADNVFVGQTSLGGTVGTESLRVSPVSNSVNYWNFYGGATSNAIAAYALGANPNININYVSKGSSGHYFLTNSPSSATQFVVFNTTSAVNYLQVIGSIAAQSPVFSSQGSDTNIPITLQTKGTGGINLAAGSSGVDISNGTTVTAITRVSVGAGYTSFPTLSLSAPTIPGGVQAVAGAIGTMNIGGGTVVSGGTSGAYIAGETLTIVGGTPVSTVGTLTIGTVSGGLITSISATNFAAYTVLPTNPISVTGGSGTGATFNVYWSIGAGSVPVTTAGSGYVESPTVTIVGGGTPTVAAIFTATVGSGTTIKSIGSSLSLSTPGGEQFRIIDTGSQSALGGTINYVSVVGSPTGNAPIIAPGGTDTNINLALAAKGTGGVTTSYNVAIGSTNLAIGKLFVSGGSIVGDQSIVSRTPSGLAAGSRGFRQIIDGTEYFALYNDNTNTVLSTTSGTTRLSINNSTAVMSLGAAAGTESLRVSPVTSAVNYVQVVGAIANAVPTISVAGSDANISLALSPKGTGNVTIVPTGGYLNTLQFSQGYYSTLSYIGVTGTGGFAGVQYNATPASGGASHYFTAYGSPTTQGQNLFSIGSAPSGGVSVNYLGVTSNTTGNSPSLSTSGSDANINLTLTPKGTGGVAFTGPLLPNNLAGTAGQVLTSAGPGAVPTWTTGSGGGGLTGATGAIGATGATGLTGSTGTIGSTGATGANGTIGSTGATGANGTIGSTGATGANGSIGSTGATGANGSIGSTGATGLTGSTGTIGSTGATGLTGATGPIAGANTQVIFNNAGVAGATGNFTFNYSTNVLSVVGTLSATGTGQNVLVGNTTIGGVSGNQSLQVNSVTSAVNYLQIAGAATNGGVSFSAQGGDNNIYITYATKGTEAHGFSTAGGTAQQFRVIHTNAVVNYINVTGSIANAAPIIATGGSDANISLTLTPKGTGTVTTASPVTITNANVSTSINTGALIVTGGVGVTGNINSGGNVNIGNASGTTYANAGGVRVWTYYNSATTSLDTVFY